MENPIAVPTSSEDLLKDEETEEDEQAPDWKMIEKLIQKQSKLVLKFLVAPISDLGLKLSEP
jgi:hypothetical protein